MKNLFLISFVLLSLNSMAGAKDRCSSELKGMPLAEIWEATHAEFRHKFHDEDSVLVLVGKMDAWGNFTILRFMVGAHAEPVDAGFYASTVNDTGTREYRRGSLTGAGQLYAELKGMNLNGMKSREITADSKCPPMSPDAALYFVESRLDKGNRFGFYGYSYEDKRYVRIMEIVDSFRTTKN